MKEESEKVGLKFSIQKMEIMASGPITRGKYMGKQWKQCQTLFFGASKSLQMVIAAIKLKEAYSLEGQLRPTYMVLEKSLESPLDCKEIQPVHSKGDQSWVFFGKTDARAETPIIWPPHAKS